MNSHLSYNCCIFLVSDFCSSSTSCYRCWRLQQRTCYSWGGGWRWVSPLLWSPHCSHTTAMWLTRVRRTRSPSQRNRSRGLVSNSAEPTDDGNDVARRFSLHALCCIPFQHFPVFVDQPRVPTASACYNTLTCTNIYMNGVSRIETAWQRCEGVNTWGFFFTLQLWHYELT